MPRAQATWTVPNYFSGAFAMHVVGSATAPTLQIVPTVSSLTVTNSNPADRTVRVRGAGFVEGSNSVCDFAGTLVTDTPTTNTINVFFSAVHDNDTVDLTDLPAYGAGVFRITTVGGTSAGVPLNALALMQEGEAPESLADEVAEEDVAVLLAEARYRLVAAGMSELRLRDVTIDVVDLAEPYLGVAAGNTIWIDRDANGAGWFVDPTPGADEEFTDSAGRLVARMTGPSDGRVDLLTVLMHELSHVGGLDHFQGDRDADLLLDALGAGECRLPDDLWHLVFADKDGLDN